MSWCSHVARAEGQGGPGQGPRSMSLGSGPDLGNRRALRSSDPAKAALVPGRTVPLGGSVLGPALWERAGGRSVPSDLFVNVCKYFLSVDPGSTTEGATRTRLLTWRLTLFPQWRLRSPRARRTPPCLGLLSFGCRLSSAHPDFLGLPDAPGSFLPFTPFLKEPWVLPLLRAVLAALGASWLLGPGTPSTSCVSRWPMAEPLRPHHLNVSLPAPSGSARISL